MPPASHQQSDHFRIAFRLDEDLIEEIVTLLDQNTTIPDPSGLAQLSPTFANQPKLKFTAEFSPNGSIETSDARDILSQPNSADARIHTLRFQSGIFTQPSVDIEYRSAPYGSSTISYRVSGDQRSTHYISSQLEQIAKRSSTWYSRIAFMDAVGILMLGTVAFFVYMMAHSAAGTLFAAAPPRRIDPPTSGADYTGVVIVGLVALAGIGVLANKLRSWLFPIGIFEIGDGKKIPARLAWWRSLIFGSILLAALVNIVTSRI